MAGPQPGSLTWFFFALSCSVLAVWGVCNSVQWSAIATLLLLLVSLLAPAPILDPDVFFICLMFTTLSTPPLWVLCVILFAAFNTVKVIQ